MSLEGPVILMRKAIRRLRVETSSSGVCLSTLTLPQVSPAPFLLPTQPLTHMCEERVQSGVL